jgi:alpha-tubulin suppressor-like RCC1 family protein
VAHFVSITSHAHHSCGIDLEGAAWCWGENRFGQLGTGDLEDRLVPTRVGSESDWQSISVGETNTCGIRVDSSLWCWGEDLDGRGNHDLLPAQLPGSFTQVSVGDDSYCALPSDGKVACRGRGYQLTDEGSHIAAVQVVANNNAVCVIDAASQLTCWGNNINGQLGDPSNLAFIPVEMAITVPGPWKSVAMGDSHACAIDTVGALSCWGVCLSGQAGRDSDTSPCAPQRVGTDTYLSVDAGHVHTCAVRSDGVMVCFGENQVGELGANSGRDTFMPTPITTVAGWTAVSAGEQFTCGLRADHEAWCWGTNRHGELGDGGGGIAFDPVAIDGAWSSVQVGFHTSCGIQADGSLWCWGSNAFGQVGDGSEFERRQPVQVGGDRDWTAVATSREVTCGIRAPGSLWCWGDNDRMQLGNGSVIASSVPVRVGSAEDWTEIAISDTNTCGIQGGDLFCWGFSVKATPLREMFAATSLRAQPNSTFLAVHDGAAFSWSQVPGNLEEPTVSNWSLLSRGLDHACGLRNNGEAWCFGANNAGQLGCCGDDRVNRTEAVREQTNGSWSALGAGRRATCAIATDGHLACWGELDMIAAGPDATDTDTAKRVGTAQWQSISVGADDACGVQTDGTLACWGTGDASTRGDGRGGHEVPARVAPP